ncbi:MAG: type II secretion system protein [Bacilli bacterium]|jgi:prepilin-type N-terminal cleavage/methylation domain-containing protein|nr:type II secretion system protein [Bacilli bacterium]
MKNKKGFTLIEILCVIVIIGILSVIATISIVNLSSKSKDNLYCAKIDLIENIAESYGIKYELELNNSNELYNGYKSLKIKVNTLVDAGKLDPDKKNDVINPKDNTVMNDIDIILYLKNNQIKAEIPNNICEK